MAEEEKFEYAILYSNGNMMLLTDDEDVEKVYPLKDRIKRSLFEGAKVYERKIKVIEDWVKID